MTSSTTSSSLLVNNFVPAASTIFSLPFCVVSKAFITQPISSLLAQICPR